METKAGYPFRFTCRRSGNCCARPGGVVRVDESTRRKIAAHLGLDETAFAARYLERSGDRLRSQPGGACVFLEPGAVTACSIHPVRPERCRTWPFWPELRDDPTVLSEAMRFCPGLEIPEDTPESEGSP